MPGMGRLSKATDVVAIALFFLPLGGTARAD